MNSSVWLSVPTLSDLLSIFVESNSTSKQVLKSGLKISKDEQMQTKFSEDVISLSDLKINPAKVINQVKDTHRPILLTSRGRGVAVVQNLDDYEKDQEERAFMKAVAQGLMDVKNGRVMELAEVKTKLAID
ncbi:conserved protein of unknown function [Methylotuvimicrobium alcaliphilum 20Z]|uniref:Antitoxin n=1 Tax=Methylotuvimicrobium alcaliphilum (strain DSM 19304 / NCIMB 14124 / VKM B-2133 / 20Z) TaxID=1091494 RepID=G4SY55_META2|nr:conserved protein of unknown function [Methylotuvimicrobium alcaliphilum 20Z]